MTDEVNMYGERWILHDGIFPAASDQNISSQRDKGYIAFDVCDILDRRIPLAMLWGHDQ
jgi:hypothetical protein